MSQLDVAHRNLFLKSATCVGCASPPPLLNQPPKAPAPTPPVRQLPPVAAAEPAKPPTIPKLANMYEEDIDIDELGYLLGEDTMEKSANILDRFLTPFKARQIPTSDAADFQTVNDINSMKGNMNKIRDPGMIYHPDGTVSIKPDEIAKSTRQVANVGTPISNTMKETTTNIMSNAGAEAGAGVTNKVEQELGKGVEQKAGGLLSRLGGKGLAIGALGTLALGGLGYGAYRAGQASQQPPKIGSGAYQAGAAY